jgi:site-specific DNA-methyltransferase (adenine-specific)
MACAIEDAGWEIRDTILWLYGSGFPKSHNLGDGRGTALKPAHEPIIMARKPLVGTVAANVQQFGTGALNIDACRVPTDEDLNGGAYAKEGGRTESQSLHAGTGMNQQGKTTGRDFAQPAGRWPANVIHDGSEEVLAAFPNAPGQLANAKTDGACKTRNVFGAMRYGRAGEPSSDSENAGTVGFKMRPGERRLDTGSAARFFYCAKASREDRNAGCDGLPLRPSGMVSNTSGQHITRRDGGAPAPAANDHPTVKPTELMRYLCRLVTPPGGVVLDPFCGSGSTGRGAVLEGFDFIGVELDAHYADIARRRVAAVQPEFVMVATA